MASRFWVGGTGTWDTSSTTHWSASSGGAGGASVPTSSDDVFINGSSGGGTITCAFATLPCKSLDFTGFAGAFTGVAFLQVAGSLTIVSGVTWTFQGSIEFNGTTTGLTIDQAGKNIGSGVSFTGVGGGWQFLSDCIIGSSGSVNFSHTAGAIDMNGFAIKTNVGGVNVSFSSSGTNVRSINLGSGTHIMSNNLGSNGSLWSVSGSNVTITPGSSTILLQNSAPNHTKTFDGGGQSYWNVEDDSSSGAALNITGNNTFNQLYINRSGGGTTAITGSNTMTTFKVSNNRTISFSTGLTQTIGALDVAGATLVGNTSNFTGISAQVRQDNFTFSGITITGSITFTYGPNATDGGSNVGWLPFNQIWQEIGATTGLLYFISVTTTGTTGHVSAKIGATGDSFNIPAGTTTSLTRFAAGSKLIIEASSDFNGTVTTVSVKSITPQILLAVFQTTDAMALFYYYANSGVWVESNLNTLSINAKNRFAVLGGKAFTTNNLDGMYTSDDGATWANGSANDCIPAANAKPSLLFRYAGRMLAAGDPTFPDRVFFSSIIDPNSSPFITWDTDPVTGDWIDVNPDDGGNITGFAEASTFVLIFKDNAMYRADAINNTVDPENIFNVGAVSQEAIATCQGVVYFFSGKDVRRTNGGYPEQISRLGVQDIIDAIPQANWENVAAGTDGFSVWFAIGDVTFTVDKTTVTIQNCELKFSPRDETWSVHGYSNENHFFVTFTDENGTLMRGADTDGYVQTHDLGIIDWIGGTPTAIEYELETQDIEFGNRAHWKQIADKVAVFTHFGAQSRIEMRVDGGTPDPIEISIDGDVSNSDEIDVKGHFFNFRWFGVVPVNQNSVSGLFVGQAPVFEGLYIEKITDTGFNNG